MDVARINAPIKLHKTGGPGSRKETRSSWDTFVVSRVWNMCVVVLSDPHDRRMFGHGGGDDSVAISCISSFKHRKRCEVIKSSYAAYQSHRSAKSTNYSSPQ
jgi:hypothetical protein